jgi:hypothetical protein
MNRIQHRAQNLLLQSVTKTRTSTSTTSKRSHLHTFTYICATTRTSFQLFSYQSSRTFPRTFPQTFPRTFSTSATNSIKNRTIKSALRTLKLQHKPNYSQLELRDAYFTAAKLCHPDSNENSHDEEDCTIRFLDITNAYEFLQSNTKLKNGNSNGNGNDNNDDADSDELNNHPYSDFIIHKTEEENFRNACREYLGLDAETVEESKRCPLFREWLKGKTDAAYLWGNFFMLHGGLAPMLNRKKVFQLSGGDGDGNGELNGNRRRRRKKNG